MSLTRPHPSPDGWPSLPTTVCRRPSMPSLRRMDPRPDGLTSKRIVSRPPGFLYHRNFVQTCVSPWAHTDLYINTSLRTKGTILNPVLTQIPDSARHLLPSPMASRGTLSEFEPRKGNFFALRVHKAPSLVDLRILNTVSYSALSRRRCRSPPLCAAFDPQKTLSSVQELNVTNINRDSTTILSPAYDCDQESSRSESLSSSLSTIERSEISPASAPTTAISEEFSPLCLDPCYADKLGQTVTSSAKHNSCEYISTAPLSSDCFFDAVVFVNNPDDCSPRSSTSSSSCVTSLSPSYAFQSVQAPALADIEKAASKGHQ